MKKTYLIIFLLVSLLLAGCSTQEEPVYYPLEPGNKWYYDMVLYGIIPLKATMEVTEQTTIDNYETHAISLFIDDSPVPAAIEYYSHTKDGLILIQTQSLNGIFKYTPEHYFFSYPLKDNSIHTWDGSIKPLSSGIEEKVLITTHTELLDSLTIPSGDYSDILKITRVQQIQSDGHYIEVIDIHWFAKGIGKIREEMYIEGELFSEATLTHYEVKK